MNLDSVFYPESLVVVGVSDRPDNLAANIIGNSLAFGYSGDVYAVGLRGGEVYGVPILTSIEQLPDGVDLAVILTPADTVPDILEACGEKGIRWAVIESGGFAEFSPVGRTLEERVRTVARQQGIRFVGPNCISVINTESGLCLPFVHIDHLAVKRGPVSVLAQSGGVSVTYMFRMSEVGLGVNKIVSMGNKADLDEADFLTYLSDDPSTEIICLYLESIEQGRRLVELAARSPKPVIVHKANVSQASTQIAQSHTAALANDDRIVDAALRQAGVARAMAFDHAVALSQGFSLPPVQGDNLVIISRSGGHAVIAADVADAYGFNLIPISKRFSADVRTLFRADVIEPTNPLDLGTIFDFELYGHIVERALSTLNPDALLLAHTYSTGAEDEMSLQLTQRVQKLSQELSKPIALCAFAQQSELDSLKEKTDYPIFTQISSAVRALAASRDRHAHPPRLLPLPTEPVQRAHEVEALLSRDGVLAADTSLGLCAACGIPVAEWAVVDSVEGALVASAGMEYPVALKVMSPDVSHKSDVGGVVLNVDGPETLRQQFPALLSRLEDSFPDVRVSGIMIQHMQTGGKEVFLGGKRDPSFGPVVAFGLGGIFVELLDAVSFRLAPITEEDAVEMIAEVKGSRLLHGLRGEPSADVDAVVEALVNLSRLLVDCPEIEEIDVNPLLVFEQGAAAVDARTVVSRQET